MYTYETSSEALSDLKKRGYAHDFNLSTDYLECKAVNQTIKPDSFEVTETYRFEGMTNPADSEIVYAIVAQNDLRGTLVSAYGMYSDEMDAEMAQKLHMSRPGNRQE